MRGVISFPTSVIHAGLIFSKENEQAGQSCTMVFLLQSVVREVILSLSERIWCQKIASTLRTASMTSTGSLLQTEDIFRKE